MKEYLMNNIRKMRFENGEMTQQELAEKLGISRMTVYSMERGRYVPSTLLALKLARVFKTVVEDIFYLTGEEGEG